MMEDSKIQQLIERLNLVINNHNDGIKPSISPTKNVVGGSQIPSIILSKSMNLETLNNSELVMVHTLLHNFYPRGKKELTKQVIEQLHKEVKQKIKHNDFDMLDKCE